MINKITLGTKINGINFRAAEEAAIEADKKEVVSIPNFEPENKGLDALAAYNAAIVKKPSYPLNKLDFEPIKPIFINTDDNEKVEGERIYSSDGKLHSIIRRDENTYTKFIPSAEDENKFSIIEVYDKKTNSLIKSQNNSEFDGKTEITVEEYNPITGENLKYADYYDGELSYSSIKIYGLNGKTESISKYDDGCCSVCIEEPAKKTTVEIYFDKNKQIKNYSEINKSKMHEKTVDVDFYNGAPVKFSQTKNMTMINTIGWDKFMNKEEFKPSAPFEKIENIKEIEGEKTYYSNGALESNTFDSEGGKVTAYFDPDGSCTKIENDDKIIEFARQFKAVTEKLGDGKEKCTKYYNTGAICVSIKDGDLYKEVSYTKQHIPSSYSESLIEDGNEKEVNKMYFNELGIFNFGYSY